MAWHWPTTISSLLSYRCLPSACQILRRQMELSLHVALMMQIEWKHCSLFIKLRIWVCPRKGKWPNHQAIGNHVFFLCSLLPINGRWSCFFSIDSSSTQWSSQSTLVFSPLWAASLRFLGFVVLVGFSQRKNTSRILKGKGKESSEHCIRLFSHCHKELYKLGSL